MSRTAKNLRDLDPFSLEVAKDAMARWNSEALEVGTSTGKWARYMRLGWMVANFTDFELTTLSDLGYLSELDRMDLADAGRAFTEPAGVVVRLDDAEVV